MATEPEKFGCPVPCRKTRYRATLTPYQENTLAFARLDGSKMAFVFYDNVNVAYRQGNHVANPIHVYISQARTLGLRLPSPLVRHRRPSRPLSGLFHGGNDQTLLQRKAHSAQSDGLTRKCPHFTSGKYTGLDRRRWLKMSATSRAAEQARNVGQKRVGWTACLSFKCASLIAAPHTPSLPSSVSRAVSAKEETPFEKWPWRMGIFRGHALRN